MRHGDTFELPNRNPSATTTTQWVVTTPEDETPTAVVAASVILNEQGLLGPEQRFHLPTLNAFLEQRRAAATESGGST